MLKKIVEKIKSREMGAILRVQSCVLKSVHDFMHMKGVVQLMPVILSPVTDPLCHSVFDAEIDYYGQALKLTKSMILHKQISLISPGIKGIYIVSPNIRLEKKECESTGKHLIEFSQVDFEFRDAKKEDIMGFMEDLWVHVLGDVLKHCRAELAILGRKMHLPRKLFMKISTKEARKLYGDDFERVLSLQMKEPFWITDHEREFYDKEHPENEREYLNYDLVYPEGFGEALSGGEREHEYKRIISRMKRNKTDPRHYSSYISLAKKGLLPRTAGAGFGVERMVRYICGKKYIEDVSLFAKVPGRKVLL